MNIQHGKDGGDEGEVFVHGKGRPDANLISSVHRFGVHPKGVRRPRKILKP